MNDLPKIRIEKDLEQEVNIFSIFLNNPVYPQNRNFIFKVFPELELQLKTSKDEKTVIQKFVVAFRRKNKKIIEQIIKENEILIDKKWSEAIKALASLMDYSWFQPIVYKAIPTILPFSPLGDNMFYFSILGQIKSILNHSLPIETKKQNTKDILYTAIHEISHFIFYDILRKIEEESKSPPIENNLRNYLKEALAVVLLNHEPLCAILNQHNYTGNPELCDLQIKKQNGEILKFTDFLQEAYQNSRINKKETFQIFLQGILGILLPLSKEFSIKREIWNRFGKELSKNPEILKTYQYPIQLKKEQG